MTYYTQQDHISGTHKKWKVPDPFPWTLEKQGSLGTITNHPLSVGERMYVDHLPLSPGHEFPDGGSYVFCSTLTPGM